jgi:hypothetical protein
MTVSSTDTERERETGRIEADGEIDREIKVVSRERKVELGLKEKQGGDG